jgi:ferritin-like protein
MTFGKDHRTYDLALAIVRQQGKREAWFSESLEQGPSGYFRRGAAGEWTCVKRFMTADFH